MREVIIDQSLELKWDGQPIQMSIEKVFADKQYKPIMQLDAVVTHRNYIAYLEKCWQLHFGAVVSPTIFWNTILNNIAFAVNKNPKLYQKYFTASEEKIEICVQQGGTMIDPALLIEGVRGFIPSNILNDTFPEFTTNTEKSVFANYVAFLDMVSPFYNYSMYLCGIPKVKVLGTNEDWQNLIFNLGKLTTAFDVPEMRNYLIGVAVCVGNMIENQDFANMFRIDFCGSGHQEEIKGWITDLFIEKPRPAYAQNMVQCISKIDYHNYNDGADYRLYAGLFTSSVDDGYLVPEFDYLYFKKFEA